MNHVSLIGRLTKEPEIKYTTSGAAVASGTIAVNRDFTNSDGERESDFINFVIWRKAAENFVNMTAKGSKIGLDGSWQTRSYENQQGQRVYVSELVVSNFTLLETKEQTEQRKGQGNSNGQQPTAAVAKPTSSPFEAVDFADDGLPF